MDASTLNAGGLMLWFGSKQVGGIITVNGATATFTPKQALALLGSYTIEVTTDAKDVHGTRIAAGWRSAFTVRNGKWSVPARVEQSPEGHASQRLQVKMDGDGNAALAWYYQSDPTANYAPRIATYGRGKGWQTPVSLDSLSTSDPYSAYLAVGNLGDIVFASGGNATIFDGKTWTSPVNISGNAEGSPNTRGLGIDDKGSGLALWTALPSATASTTSLYARAYSTDFGWTSELDILVPQMVMDTNTWLNFSLGGAGVGMLVWSDASTGSNLWSLRYDSAATPPYSAPAQVPDGTQSAHTALAVGDDGAGLVAWRRATATGSAIAVKPFDNLGVWGPTSVLDESGIVDSPAVAVTAGTSAAVAWSSRGTNATDIRVSHYAAPSGWSTPFRVATGPNPQAAGGRAATVDPQLFLDAAGNGFVFWTIPAAAASPNQDVFCRYASGSWSKNAEPVTGATNSLGTFSALSANGDAISVWSVCDSSEGTGTANCVPWYRVFE